MDHQPHSTVNRRQVLKGAGVLVGVVALGGAGVLAWRGSSDPAPNGGPSSLDTLADAVTSGGPGKDGIPAIDRPRFVSARQADFLRDDEPVFGLEYRGEVRAYPQQVLVWHEIVNDTVANVPLSVTYCPLTGTVIAFTADTPVTFGTTGNLVNSNLLMYDRQTDSDWPQILGTAISGKRKGQRLATVPLVWTTWKAWRGARPHSTVLSTDTGALRDYGSDPYGSYPNRSGYYTDESLIFPVGPSDDRFPAKEVVVGARVGDTQLAIHKELVRSRKTVETDAGGTRLVARWDDALDTARVFVGGTDEPADFLDAMWFAWYAFYPHTQVLR